MRRPRLLSLIYTRVCNKTRDLRATASVTHLWTLRAVMHTRASPWRTAALQEAALCTTFPPSAQSAHALDSVHSHTCARDPPVRHVTVSRDVRRAAGTPSACAAPSVDLAERRCPRESPVQWLPLLASTSSRARTTTPARRGTRVVEQVRGRLPKGKVFTGATRAPDRQVCRCGSSELFRTCISEFRRNAVHCGLRDLLAATPSTSSRKKSMSGATSTVRASTCARRPPCVRACRTCSVASMQQVRAAARGLWSMNQARRSERGGAGAHLCSGHRLAAALTGGPQRPTCTSSERDQRLAPDGPHRGRAAAAFAHAAGDLGGTGGGPRRGRRESSCKQTELQAIKGGRGRRSSGGRVLMSPKIKY